MIDLVPIIERIRALLAEDTDASVTYAALEARLALEKVCYDRLRQCHDYISHSQLSRWQPGQVVKTLIQEVDQYAATTRTVLISRKPARADVRPEDDEYVPLGTEIGFSPKIIEKMWNALAKLALHVRLPEHKEDQIPDYGDKEAIRGKVLEAIEELGRLSKSTMSFSGFGEEVSFECSCGERNRRRAALLHEGQIVHCMNPDCKEAWRAEKDGDGFIFELLTVSIRCERCDEIMRISQREAFDLGRNQVLHVTCDCGHENHIKWVLKQVKPASD